MRENDEKVKENYWKRQKKGKTAKKDSEMKRTRNKVSN